jgi:colanic acid/amylovoran biosynthesis glycosyltransferase
LPTDFDWHWTHIGGGDLKDQLRAQATDKGVGDRITWRGACDQPEVIDEMRKSGLFVLPSRVAEDGDRDGLPNVLMEAASQMLPILSTPVSAIPEFIDSGTHGLLVEDDPAKLAQAILLMAQDGQKRENMAKAAIKRLRAEFGVDKGIDQLTARLNGMIDGA